MFTHDDMRSLLSAEPFVPFRLRLTDGGHLDIASRELVFPGRRYALIALLDPAAPDLPFDRYATVWYFHVARVEMLAAGTPPFSAPSGPSTAPAPA